MANEYLNDSNTMLTLDELEKKILPLILDADLSEAEFNDLISRISFMYIHREELLLEEEIEDENVRVK